MKTPAAPGAALTHFAPAKINLALHVVGRRADGYHLLDSLVAFADCGDSITVEPGAEDAFTVTGPYADGVPTDANNLVLRARDGLRQHTGQTFFPVCIHLEKRLPIASGIGGGSSDAAATLKALCTLWHLDLSPVERTTLGLSLGADLPMCLLAEPARVTGIGEGVMPIGALPSLPTVLVNPGVAVSTPAIFKQLTKRDNPPLVDLPAATSLHAWLEWVNAARNDLQGPAIAVAPVIADVLDALTSVGAACSRMSGSGATCFGLFNTHGEANTAAAALSRSRPTWYVQAATLKGSNRAS